MFELSVKKALDTLAQAAKTLKDLGQWSSYDRIVAPPLSSEDRDLGGHGSADCGRGIASGRPRAR